MMEFIQNWKNLQIGNSKTKKFQKNEKNGYITKFIEPPPKRIECK